MLFDALTFLYKFPICQTAIERYRAAQGKNDYTYFAHDLAVGPADKFPIYLTAYKTRQPGFSYSRFSFPSIRYLFSAPPYRRMLKQQYSHSMAIATAYTEP